MQPSKIFKVFVSSTYEDLREERAEVQKSLLKLNCLPVGMELFPAADAETWEFIKEQIDDSDYYVLLIAGRYGSLAPDGISFTEKEFDYARSRNKPSIAFLHADRNQIPSGKIERDPSRLSLLDLFISKVKQRPIQTFRTPHDLATEVVTSFVDLMRRKPAIGYVRADNAADYKKYSDALEENEALRKRPERLSDTEDKGPFLGYEQPIRILIAITASIKPAGDIVSRKTDIVVRHGLPEEADSLNLEHVLEVEVPLGKLLVHISSDLIIAQEEDLVVHNLQNLLVNQNSERVDQILGELNKLNKRKYEVSYIKMHETSIEAVRNALYARDLIDITVEKRASFRIVSYRFSTKPKTNDRDAKIWKFTQYGRLQLAVLESVNIR